MHYETKAYKGYEYIVYKLTKNEDSIILNEVIEKAKEDYKKQNKKAPSGEIRPDDLIYCNNIGGVLAEKVVRLHLQGLIDKHKINARLLPSSFTTHAEHKDIKIEINGRIKTIEIRSSFNYLTSLENVLTWAFSLLGKYTTSYKLEEPDKDFYITIIHRYKNREILSKLANSVEVFIIGGASREIFNKRGIKNDPKLKQEDANYLTIRPIISAPNLQLVFNEILENQEEKRVSNY